MMDLTFGKTSSGITARGVLTWYCASGHYRIEVVGSGFSEVDAEANAMLMLGQARATLVVIKTIEDCSSLSAPIDMAEI